MFVSMNLVSSHYIDDSYFNITKSDPVFQNKKTIVELWISDDGFRIARCLKYETDHFFVFNFLVLINSDD